MKTPEKWKSDNPVLLLGVIPDIIKEIQDDAYNQCLLDLIKDHVLPDSHDTYIKYAK